MIHERSAVIIAIYARSTWIGDKTRDLKATVQNNLTTRKTLLLYACMTTRDGRIVIIIIIFSCKKRPKQCLLLFEINSGSARARGSAAVSAASLSLLMML